ncbi:MAG: peptidylprolyl isomerase [Chloroflexi bacterium]|nr:peptidylprolyl isomerase [Chloroflexota bacterium]MCI0575071.1 peptidylprolyl isomerase [Chloroflexota bacterium]MCI0643597.1 peptidylprolyl isomerase [Chloroflexota bacterium]MCI0726219.1 peptidylprolyl isomerase [Chloroflexota bacterium]
METNPLTIDDDDVVSLAYSLRLDDGQEVDSSDGDDPLEFIQGYGQIIPGLEEALYGMAVGEEKQVVVEPEDGYGHYDVDDFSVVPRDAFPPELTLAPGMGLSVQDSESGEVFQAYVAELHSDSVVLDFNHPLAGETLHFQVKIVGLRAATDEELEHGHVHDNGHSH